MKCTILGDERCIEFREEEGTSSWGAMKWADCLALPQEDWTNGAALHECIDSVDEKKNMVRIPFPVVVRIVAGFASDSN